MFMVTVSFRCPPTTQPDDDQISQVLNNLLSFWRMNGQVLGREFGIAAGDQEYRISVLCPEATSLDLIWANRYVRAGLAAIEQLGLVLQLPVVVGQDIDGADGCECSQSSSYILTTDYLSLESPIRCGDCFGPVPLYRLPKTYDDEYYNIICWQSDYQACDRLFMNSRVLERATNREMAKVDSALSRQGREICHLLTQLTSVPTYYHIKTHYGRSLAKERARRCPACGGAWALVAAWHRFDFRCDGCQLVGNIAYDCRP
jgi:predicted  nucleic acid-binding Zn ribbon protein